MLAKLGKVALAGAALTAAAAADAQAVNFSGSMTGAGVVTPDPSCAPIPNHGSITNAPGTSPLGAFTYSHSVCTQGAVGPVVGTFVIDFGASQFSGTLNGAATADPTPGLFDLLLHYTITAGTGQFAAATGSFDGSGTADPSFHPSVVHLNFTAVPEPASWALMLIGFGAMGFAMRARQPRHLGALA